MTSTFTYGTARAVMMVGFHRGPGSLTPQRIGPAHATIGNVRTAGRKSLCGAFALADENLPWPPPSDDSIGLCPQCEELARL